MKSQFVDYYLIQTDELRSLMVSVAENPSYANLLWDRFDYKNNLALGNYFHAHRKLVSLLHSCQNIDYELYEKCHKGTPFYWLGMINYYLRNYQEATFFFEAAVAQDLRLNIDPILNPTPAIYFLTLQGDKDNQAAYRLVQVTEQKVKRIIHIYNNLPGRSQDIPDLTLEKIREKFLFPALSPNLPEWRTLTTTFITFFVEWDDNNELFDLRQGDGTIEPFFLHLIKGCVLFESLLKNNRSKPVIGANTLGRLFNFLHEELGVSRNLKFRDAKFSGIVDDLKGIDDSVENSIIITCKVRNSLAHNFGWNVNLEKDQYFRLFYLIAATCFHAINSLY